MTKTLCCRYFNFSLHSNISPAASKNWTSPKIMMKDRRQLLNTSLTTIHSYLKFLCDTTVDSPRLFSHIKLMICNVSFFQFNVDSIRKRYKRRQVTYSSSYNWVDKTFGFSLTQPKSHILTMSDAKTLSFFNHSDTPCAAKNQQEVT